MVGKYEVAGYFRDGQTRLFIPNLAITATDALTNLASSFVTSPQTAKSTFFPTREKVDNTWDQIKKNKNIYSKLTTLIDTLSIGLGVTKIETSQEYTMPLSKGIGSTGEVIHLLGAKNEIINIEFKTDDYPGRLGYVLRSLLQKILETTQVVYLVDDLFLATPCIIRKSRLYKEGNYRGAVMGDIELISLTTGGNWIKDKLGGVSTIAKKSKTLKSAIGHKGLGRVVGTTARIGIGALSLSAILLVAIASGSI